MLVLEDLGRKVFSFIIRTAGEKQASAHGIIEHDLGLYFRHDLVSAVNIEQLLSHTVPTTSSLRESRWEIFDYIADSFHDTEGAHPAQAAKDLRAKLESEMEMKYHIEDAHKIIGTNLGLDKEERELFNKMKPECVKIMSGFLMQFFDSRVKEWIREHTGVEQKQDLSTDEADMEELYNSDWDKGLVKDLIHLIDREVPDQSMRRVYKLLMVDFLMREMTSTEQRELTRLRNLHKNLPSDSKRKQEIKQEIDRLEKLQMSQGSFKAISEKTGIKPHILSKYHKHLVHNILVPYLQGRMEFLKGLKPVVEKDEPTEEGQEESKVENYKKVLKDPEKSKEFKSYIRDYTGGLDPKTLDIINLLSEGMSISEIEEKGFNKGDIYNKNKYFQKWYKEWMNQREKKAFMLPYEKISAEMAPSRKTYENMVDEAIRKQQVKAVIEVSADYSRKDFKDDKQTPVNFKWLAYTVSLDRSKQVGKVLKTIQYELTQKLKPEDGTFMGHPDSILKLDGVTMPTNDPLKKDLDEHVETFMKKEGVLPSGRSMSREKGNLNAPLHVLFPVKYIVHDPVKGTKEMGIEEFKDDYRDLVVVDPVQKERHELVEKKQRGLNIDPDEKERIKKLSVKVQRLLDRAKFEKDASKIEKLTECLKILDMASFKTPPPAGWEWNLEEKKKIMAIIDPMLSDFQSKTAAALPPPDANSDFAKLLLILDKYKVNKPNPYSWLTTGDILTLAKTLKARAKLQVQTVLKAIKNNKDMKREERESKGKLFKNEVIDDLKKASEYFKSLPEDLKKRRDKIEPGKEEVFKGLDLNWVNNEEAIKKNLERIHNEFKEVFVDPEKFLVIERDPKTHGALRILEQNKFDSLKNYLRLDLRGFRIIGERLEKAGLEPKEFELKDVQAAEDVTEAEIEEMLSSFTLDKGAEILKDTAGMENEPIFKEMEKEIGQLKEERAKTITNVKNKDVAPALRIAWILQDKATEFSSFYSLFSSFTQFGQWEHFEKQGAEEGETPIDDLKTKEVARNKLAAMSIDLSHNQLIAKDAIKADLAKLRPAVKKFIAMFDTSRPSIHYAPTKPPKEKPSRPTAPGKPLYPMSPEKTAYIPYEVIGSVCENKSISYDDITAADWQDELLKLKNPSKPKEPKKAPVYTPKKTPEKAPETPKAPEKAPEAPKDPKTEMSPAQRAEQLKMVFVEKDLMDAKDMVTKLKEKKGTKGYAEQAQKELTEIVKNNYTVYRELSKHDKEVEDLAKKHKITPAQASVIALKNLRTLAKGTLDRFILKWQDVEDEGHLKRERSDLRNRQSHEYEKIHEYLEEHLPTLYKMVTPEKKHEVTPGIPTPKHIRERIEDMFTQKKPEEMTELVEPDEHALSGPGKGKGVSTRPKPIKMRPPNPPKDRLKESVKNIFHLPADKIVDTVMKEYLEIVHDWLFDKIGDGDKDIDIDGVVDGFVTLLKGPGGLYQTLLSMDVRPSTASHFQMPPPGTPKLTGQPDIKIDSPEDVHKVYDKYMEIYKKINEYIAPDEVGMPPKNLSNLSKSQMMKRVLPQGLVDYYQHILPKQEKPEEYKKYMEQKQAFVLPMNLRVAGKFFGVPETTEESIYQ